MKNTKNDFKSGKKNAMSKLTDALSENLVDKKIIPIISIINKSPEYYTTSSCAGRIVLMQIPNVGDKKNAVFLGRWHRKIDLKDLNQAAENADKGQLWLIAQSPIFHIACISEESAEKILKIAYTAGFKHSSIKSLGKTRIIVEVCSTERMDFPLGEDGEILCNEKFLGFLVKISNELIDRLHNKLDSFYKILKKNFK